MSAATLSQRLPGATPPGPPRVPRQGRSMGAAALAICMHGLLFALLFFGLRWQSQPPAVIEAEIWSAAPQYAAPAPAAAPEPEPQAPVATVQPQAAPKPLPPAKPDIALKQHAKKEPPKKIPPKVEAKAPAKPVPETKAAPKPVAKAEPKAQPRPDAPAAPAEPAAPSDLQNLLAAAARPNTGTAARTAGAAGSNSYGDAIRAKIRSNLRFPVPANLAGNPEAEFQIEQLPSGEIIRVTKRKASGLPGYDEAIERAINASSPLPKGNDGRVDRTLNLVFRPQEDR